MRDMNLVLPVAPAGMEAADHMLELLEIASQRAAGIVDQLHVAVRDDLEDAAANASTLLRELRQAIKVVVGEGDPDVDELTYLLAAIDLAIEEGDHVLMQCELRDALRDDEATWRQCAERALCIGELAGAQYMSFVSNEVADRALYDEVRQDAPVPLMHALVRATAAGVADGLERPLEVQDATDRIDTLLAKTLRVTGMARADDPFLDLRCASTTSVALWNFTRIALRDDMGEGRRAQYETRRRSALRSIKADTRFQLERLGCLPDYEHAYDVGMALAAVEPIIARRAELHDLRVPRRANPAAWLALFNSPG